MNNKFDRQQLRRLIQQEILSLGEDMIVEPKDNNSVKQGTPPLSPASSMIPKKACDSCGREGDSCACQNKDTKHYHEEGESCHECGEVIYECACQTAEIAQDSDYSLDTMLINDKSNSESPSALSSQDKHRGAYMSKSQLHKIEKYSQKLYHLIPKGFDLEDWMRTKIAQISDDISEVYHALDHDDFEDDI